MKIKIKLQPVVEYPFNMDLVNKLIDLSKGHYDGVCKSLGQSVECA